MVNKLERLNLICTERDLNDRIINFDFDLRLKDKINNSNLSEDQSILGFSLERKINRTNEMQRNYCGILILKEDVILKAGEVYLYGGWIQND